MEYPPKRPVRSSATQEQFYELFNTSTFTDIFNEKYMDGLEKRRDLLDSQARKFQTIQTLSLSLLTLSILSIHLPISFLSFSTANVRDLREILLVAYAYILFYITPLVVEQNYIRDLLEAHVRRLSKGHDVALLALKTRYGLNPASPEWKFSSLRYAYFVLSATGGLIVSFLLMIVSSIIIPIVALFDIVRDPTVSVTVSILVVIYFIGSTAANMLLGIQTALARFRGRIPEW
jgi:hypothetical protein